MSNTLDHDDLEFCTAHALIVALEERGLAWLSSEAMALLGEARAEFTDLDLHRPTTWVDVNPTTPREGLTALHQAMTTTLQATSALPDRLRITRASALVAHAATRQATPDQRDGS